MDKYKIEFASHFKNGKWILFYMMMFFVSLYIYLTEGHTNFYYAFAIGAFVLLLIQLLPLTALHINYYITNRGDELVYDNVNERFTFIHSSGKIEFNLKDIKRVILHRSRSLNGKGGSKAVCSKYHFAIIYLESGERIIITTLLIGSDIDIPVDKEIIEVKTDYCRLVKGKSYTTKSYTTT